MNYTFNVIHRVTSQVENLKNKVDGLEGENNDIRKEVEKLKNDKLEQDQEHSYRVCIISIPFLLHWFCKDDGQGV